MNQDPPAGGRSSAGPSVELTRPQIPDHELVRVIGRGSYGEVWLARNLMGTWRAIKVVRRSDFEDERPLLREFNGIRKFEPVSRSHEGMVDILQLGANEAEGYFYYVMELADPADMESQFQATDSGEYKTEGRNQTDSGEGRAEFSPDQSDERRPPRDALPRDSASSLAGPATTSEPGRITPETYRPRTLRSEAQRRGRLSFPECLRIAVSLADALRHLHGRGLVHRDIKPSNIIFVNGIPKLADIGLVTESGDPKTFVGTEGFIPPEGPGSARADLYALGKTLYEASTGLDRLRFPEPRVATPGDPDCEDWAEFNEVVVKACEPEIRRRYASADELRQDLVLLQGGKSVRRLRAAERRLKHLTRVAAVAMGLLVVGSIAGWMWGRARTARVYGQFQSLMSEGQTIRLAPHRQGWSARSIDAFRKAGRKRIDDAVRSQFAATLAGLDASLNRVFTEFGATTLAFDAPGERLLIVAPDGQQARLWRVGTEQLEPLAVTNVGMAVFDSAGGARVLAYRRKGILHITDPVDGKLIRELRVPQEVMDIKPESAAMVLSPNAAYCALCVYKGTATGRLVLWDVASGDVLKIAEVELTIIEFSPDSSLLATGDTHGHVGIRTVPHLEESTSWPHGNTAIQYLSWQRDPHVGRGTNPPAAWRIAVAASGGNFGVWDARTGGLISLCRGSAGDVLGTAFSPDGMTLGSAGREDVRLWDVASGRLLLSLIPTPGLNLNFASALAFSPDGRRLVVGTRPDFNIWWTVSADDGRDVYVGAPSGAQEDAKDVVSVWDIESDRGITTLLGLTAPVAKVRYSSDSRKLAALSHDWRVAVWDLGGPRLEWIFDGPQGWNADLAGLALSRDGTRLVVSAAKEARMWDLGSGVQVRDWTLPWGLADEMTFATDDRLLLFRAESLPSPPGPSAGRRWSGVGRVRDLFGVDPKRPLFELTEFSERIADACLSEDGAYLFVAGRELRAEKEVGMAKAFDTRTGKELFAFPFSPTNAHATAVFDPAGKVLAWSDSGDPSLALFNLPFGTRSHISGLSASAVSPGGKLLAKELPDSGCSLVAADGSMQTIALATDLRLSSRPRFSRDGSRLAFGSSDGTVLLCDLTECERRFREAGLGW